MISSRFVLPGGQEKLDFKVHLRHSTPYELVGRLMDHLLVFLRSTKGPTGGNCSEAYMEACSLCMAVLLDRQSTACQRRKAALIFGLPVHSLFPASLVQYRNLRQG